MEGMMSARAASARIAAAQNPTKYNFLISPETRCIISRSWPSRQPEFFLCGFPPGTRIILDVDFAIAFEYQGTNESRQQPRTPFLPHQQKAPADLLDRVHSAVARGTASVAASLSLVESKTRRFSGCKSRGIRAAEQFSGSGQYVSRRFAARSPWLSAVARRGPAGDTFESCRSNRTLGSGGAAPTGHQR